MTHDTDHWLNTPTPAEIRLAGAYTATGKRAWRPSPAKSQAMRSHILTRDDNQCQACGQPGPLLELDHIKPYKLGGYFVASNLQALCQPCNITKGADPS